MQRDLVCLRTSECNAARKGLRALPCKLAQRSELDKDDPPIFVRPKSLGTLPFQFPLCFLRLLVAILP
jgi:hypothetical protein